MKQSGNNPFPNWNYMTLYNTTTTDVNCKKTDPYLKSQENYESDILIIYSPTVQPQLTIRRSYCEDIGGSWD